jgi:hypothetical protein
MARAHIEFIESGDVAAEPVLDGAFAGIRRRMLSADDGGVEHTALGHFPAGWSRAVAGASPVELFCLTGRASIAGEHLRPGCYAYVPSGAGDAVLAAAEDSDILIMVEAERAPEPGACVEVKDQAQIAWHMPGPNPDRALGIAIKLFREDPLTKDWTWVSAVVPGWLSRRAEVHPTIEECLMLRGDILLGDRGVMHGGSYFWRPPFVEHGPMYSRDGAFFFFRTKGGSLTTTFVDVPGWEEQVERYAAGAPFYAAA